MADEKRLADWKIDFPLELVSDTGLLFCPWCGKNLVRFYGNRAGELMKHGYEIPLPISTA